MDNTIIHHGTLQSPLRHNTSVLFVVQFVSKQNPAKFNTAGRQKEHGREKEPDSVKIYTEKLTKIPIDE